MGFSNSLYNGVSGLNSMSQQLNITANNVANANSTGFKTSHSTFADIMDSASRESVAIGHGVQFNAIDTSFAYGSIENTNRPTDMAINGAGFFQVRNADNATADRYTRNGEFELNASSAEPQTYHLLTATGQFVQGINQPDQASSPAVVEDIVIQRTMPQSATSEVKVITNLESQPGLLEGVDTPLFASWDGRNSPAPLADGLYDFKTSLKIYGPDDGSTPGQTNYDYLTIYYDSTSKPNEKEFLITCDPASDQRVLADGTTHYDSATDKGAGALLYGTLRFTTNGDLNGIDCWSVPPSGEVAPDPANKIELGRGDAYYAFDYNFSGSPTNSSSTINFGNSPKPQAVISPASALVTAPSTAPASSTSSWEAIRDSAGNGVKIGDTLHFLGKTGDGAAVDYSYAVASGQSMQDLLLGLEGQFACKAEIINGQLTLTDTVVGSSQLAIDSISYANASGATPLTDASVAQIFGNQGAAFTVKADDRFDSGPLATTNYASPSVSIFQGQNGFGQGVLETIDVNTQGIINAHYSNGQASHQAQFVLTDFSDLQGLRSEGNNTFVATAEAGTPIHGLAGQGGFGAVTNNALEASNVDLGREMADIIITQRAFQANAKSITTSDEIYDTVLQILRR